MKRQRTMGDTLLKTRGIVQIGEGDGADDSERQKGCHDKTEVTLEVRLTGSNSSWCII